MANGRREDAVIHIPTPDNHEAQLQAKVERPIRTITEASRAVVAHGNGDNIRLWPVGCLATVKAMCTPPLPIMASLTASIVIYSSGLAALSNPHVERVDV